MSTYDQLEADYKNALRAAAERGWRVPITEPIDHAAWLFYWDLLANGRDTGAPDNITFMERTEAQSLGRVRYWTGRECLNGHIAPRYVTSGACSLCVAAAQRRGKFKNPDLLIFKARIHKDDEPMLRATMEALNAARGL